MSEAKRLDILGNCEGRVIDYLRYLNGEGLMGDDVKRFRAEHYSNPYRLGKELYVALISPLIEDAKKQERRKATIAMNTLVNNVAKKVGEQEKERIISYLESMAWVFNPEKELPEFRGIIQELKSGVWRALSKEDKSEKQRKDS